jgi:RND family efflux transporter MFP subunit
MSNASGIHTVWKTVGQIGVALAMLVGVVVIMMWLMGVFGEKVDTAQHEAYPARPVGQTPLATVENVAVPRVESAVGSVEPVHRTAVASKLLATVTEVNITAGQRVEKGDVLVRLDDADLKARVEQAAAAVSSAEAAREQAQVEYDRVEKLRQQGAATPIEMERVDTALKSARAELKRAQEAKKEAETILSYATILSPIDGVVVDKEVEPGDTVSPGQVVANLYDRMQLVARVRESLKSRLEVGQSIKVEVEALGHACEGKISEIVPEAESASRTFSVKVTGPCPPGVYPGMFGRLQIPLGEEHILMIPQQAVAHVGQLNIVEVARGDTLHRRAVQLGRRIGDRVQVLSGLREGERVALQQPGEA